MLGTACVGRVRSRAAWRLLCGRGLLFHGEQFEGLLGGGGLVVVGVMVAVVLWTLW